MSQSDDATSRKRSQMNAEDGFRSLTEDGGLMRARSDFISQTVGFLQLALRPAYVLPRAPARSKFLLPYASPPRARSSSIQHQVPDIRAALTDIAAMVGSNDSWSASSELEAGLQTPQFVQYGY